MVKPLLYISFGMAKSGSTLAYQLVRSILEASGAPQPLIPLPHVIRDGSVNFVEVIRPKELEALLEYAEYDAAGTPLAIKTHSGLWKCVADAMDKGLVIGHAVCRDPRDVALSMMDASRDGRAWGRRDGEPLRNIEDALEAVRGNAVKFESWAAQEAIMPLAYPKVAFDSEAVVTQIATQLGVEVDARAIAKAARKSGTNFNKGVHRRHEKELSEAVAARIATEFSGFIDTYCDDGFQPTKRGLLGRLGLR